MFLTDTHIGYATKCRTHKSGQNQRVIDGYQALENSITHAIETHADLVIHGGDIFHRSWPTIADITYTRSQLNRLTDAGIQIIGTTGNHDAAAERAKAPATAAINDPDRGIHFITDPIQQFHPTPGITITVVTHYALTRTEHLTCEPTHGEINILLAHGAAMVPDHPVFTCTDSPGEQALGHDLLTAGWNISLLGHYHGRGKLPGIGNGDEGTAWYGGSALRRGFSDPEGTRGGLDVTITNTGIKVEPFNIWQRPQHDLPTIDASGLTGNDLHDQIAKNITTHDIAEAIVRQNVKNVTAAHRASMNLPRLTELAATALVWQPVLTRPDLANQTETNSDSLTSAGSVNMPEAFTAWLPNYARTNQIPTTLETRILKTGTQHLNAADPYTRPNDMLTQTNPGQQ